jgi:hypothetical protein
MQLTILGNTLTYVRSMHTRHILVLSSTRMGGRPTGCDRVSPPHRFPCLSPCMCEHVCILYLLGVSSFKCHSVGMSGVGIYVITEYYYRDTRKGDGKMGGRGGTQCQYTRCGCCMYSFIRLTCCDGLGLFKQGVRIRRAMEELIDSSPRRTRVDQVHSHLG